MTCPQCKEENERSRVHIGPTFVTAMAGSQFYDEDGKLHVHDPNARTTSYECSRGHQWRESVKPKCTTCGHEGW